MKKYLVRVEGRDFQCEVAAPKTGLSRWLGRKRKSLQRVGFFATRLVEAETSQEAASLATELAASEFVEQVTPAQPSTGQVQPLWTKEVEQVPADIALRGFTLYLDPHGAH